MLLAMIANSVSIESSVTSGTKSAKPLSSASFAVKTATIDIKQTANGLTQRRSRNLLSKKRKRSVEIGDCMVISFTLPNENGECRFLCLC